MGYKVVVAGATGNVGREMLNILAERQFPVDEIAVLASRRSLGTEVSFGDTTLTTQDIDTFDFSRAGTWRYLPSARRRRKIYATAKRLRRRAVSSSITPRSIVTIPDMPADRARGEPARQSTAIPRRTS